MKNNGIVSKILSVLLGFILGVGGTVGGVVGAGYYIGMQPLDEAANTIDGFTAMGLSDLLFGEGEKAGILDDYYADKYVKDLLGDTAGAIKNISNGGTLSDFNAISPKVEVVVNKLIEKANTYGIPLNLEELMTKPIKATNGEEGISQYFVTSLKSTPISGLFTAMGEEPEGLFAYICYGEEGVDYDIVDGEVIMHEGKTETTVSDLISSDMMPLFEKVPLAVVATPTIGDPAMLSICYGREGVTYQIENASAPNGTEAKVTMLNVFYTMEEGKFLDYSGAEMVGTEVTSDKVGYVKIQLPTAEGEDASYIYLEKPTAPETKYYAYQPSANDTLIKMTYQKTKLSDIMGDAMGIVDKILLKDVLDGDGEKTNAVLKSLCYDKNGNPNSIGQLREQGGALVDAIPLSTIMSAEKNNLVLYMLYGHEGVHFKETTVAGKTEYKMLQQFIAIHDGKVYDEYGTEIPASQYTLDTTAKTYTVKAGDETITYTYKTSATDTIKLTDEITVPRNYLFDSKNKAVMFEETKLGDFARTNNKLDTITTHLTIRDIFGDKVDDNKILGALADSRIDNIGDAVMDIEISALFSEEDLASNKILASLEGSTLNTLSDDINNLTMENIFGEEEVNSNSILKNLADKKLDELPGAVENLTVEDVLHDQIYYYDATTKQYKDKDGNVVDKMIGDKINPAAINPAWKYLLKSGDTIHTEYKLTQDMNNLIDNMKANVHDATLRELYEDDLVDKNSLNPGTLDTELKFSIGGFALPRTNFTEKMNQAADGLNILEIGDLTVQEMLVYVSSVISVI